VTTIPAAAYLGVAAGLGEATEALGALAVLATNVAMIVAAAGTLGLSALPASCPARIWPEASEIDMRELLFRHVPSSAMRRCQRVKAIIQVGRGQQHRDLRTNIANASGEIEAVAIGKADVEQHGVWGEAFRIVKASRGAVSLTHDAVATPLEQNVHGPSERGSVVDD
jgi:hypothetical protein